MKKLPLSFYTRDVLAVAPDLCGKYLCCKQMDGSIKRLRITQTEAYRGEEDTACHAHKGKTPRTKTMYARAGTIYVYLCYGIHNLCNIVTGPEGFPQAVLIRACEGADGPGKLTKALGITRALNGKMLGEELWVEDDALPCEITTDTRVGIGYASPEDQAKLWRYICK